MSSHDLAKKLLSLPDLPVYDFDSGGLITDARVDEIPDEDHPHFTPFDIENSDDTENFIEWELKQPKKKVILLEY